jgi:hypothetical protein
MTEYAAGRELDALIAEKVMGWRRCPIQDGPYIHFDTGTGGGIVAPAYSTSIAAAWEVWNKVTEGEGAWRWAIYSSAASEVDVEYYGEHYIGDREAGCGWSQESGPFPLAICRAALMAVAP